MLTLISKAESPIPAYTFSKCKLTTVYISVFLRFLLSLNKKKRNMNYKVLPDENKDIFSPINSLKDQKCPGALKGTKERTICALANHNQVKELANLTLLSRFFPNKMSNNYLI